MWYPSHIYPILHILALPSFLKHSAFIPYLEWLANIYSIKYKSFTWFFLIPFTFYQYLSSPFSFQIIPWKIPEIVRPGTLCHLPNIVSHFHFSPGFVYFKSHKTMMLSLDLHNHPNAAYHSNANGLSFWLGYWKPKSDIKICVQKFLEACSEATLNNERREAVVGITEGITMAYLIPPGALRLWWPFRDPWYWGEGAHVVPNGSPDADQGEGKQVWEAVPVGEVYLQERDSPLGCLWQTFPVAGKMSTLFLKVDTFHYSFAIILLTLTASENYHELMLIFVLIC